MLSDPKKRSRYDNGQDLDDMGSGMSGDAHDIDPNLLFNIFFSGGGGNSFGGGSGGGSSGRSRGGFGGQGFQFNFG